MLLLRSYIIYIKNLVMNKMKGQKIIFSHTSDGWGTPQKLFDGLDNRRCNLRIVTRSQNHMNRRKALGFTSGFKGVFWVKRVGKWGASIGINYKDIHLGYFSSEIDAAHAYDKAAYENYGDFAILNLKGELEK